jgi:hypothetical protein
MTASKQANVTPLSQRINNHTINLYNYQKSARDGCKNNIA